MSPAEQQRLLLEAIASRSLRSFRLPEHCFKQQLDWIMDPARFKTAVCSRRAGKSIGCALDMLATAESKPGAAVLYLTLTRLQAKRIIWGPLKEMNERHGFGGHANESELSMRMRNGSVIYLAGAKDAQSVSKYLGFPLIKVFIDEAQSFRPYLETLVDDVLGPTLWDYRGTCTLLGTPAPVPTGYFYERSQSKKWSNHHWTMFDNPHIKLKSGREPMELVLEDCERMEVTIDHPRIQRNCFGLWVVDSDSLVLHYSASKNDFDQEPLSLRWENVISVDLGFEDADAIGVLGWPEEQRAVYLREEIVVRKQGITELAEQLTALVERYKPLALVMDTGGLGKKIAEELRKRYSLPIKAAEKVRKFENLEILDDAMRLGQLKARRSSVFAHDCNLVEWDKEKTTPERKVISDRFHSDAMDMVLYGFRECYHWLHQAPKAKPRYGTPEWYQKEADDMEEAAAAKLEHDDSDPGLWEVSGWN